MRKDMLETTIQALAVRALRQCRVRFFAVPNGGKRDKPTGSRLWKEGVQAGVPDLLLIDPPNTGKVGTAIEVKALKGKPTPEQLDWLSAFEARGWEIRVTYGPHELFDALVDLGYVTPQVAESYGRSAPYPTEASPRRSAAALARPSARGRGMPKRGKVSAV